jgi:hypothetical protein
MRVQSVCLQSVEEARGDARLLKEDIFKLDFEVSQRRKLREEQACAPASEDEATVKNTRNAHKMLVDLYRPKSFINLLSDERTNRNVLEWLHLWQALVFAREPDGKDMTRKRYQGKFWPEAISCTRSLVLALTSLA